MYFIVVYILVHPLLVFMANFSLTSETLWNATIWWTIIKLDINLSFQEQTYLSVRTDVSVNFLLISPLLERRRLMSIRCIFFANHLQEPGNLKKHGIVQTCICIKLVKCLIATFTKSSIATIININWWNYHGLGICYSSLFLLELNDRTVTLSQAGLAGVISNIFFSKKKLIMYSYVIEYVCICTKYGRILGSGDVFL